MIRNLVRAIGAVFVLFVVGLILVAAFPLAGAVIMGLLATGAIVLVRWPEIVGERFSRVVSIPVALVTLLFALASTGVYFEESAKERELVQLKQADPAAYLQKVREDDGDSAWLDELEEIDPEAYRVEQDRRAAEAEEKRLAEAKQKEEAAREEREAKRQDYAMRLKREFEGLEKYDDSGCFDNKTTVLICTALFSAWATIAEEGGRYELDKKERALLVRFKKRVAAVQARSLPRLRDAYGPILRKALWEVDISAKTFGKWFRVVQFVGGVFAANRNIKEFHSQVREGLVILRFNQARYMWYEQADEYQYFTIDTPKDTDLVIWERNGRFRRVS
ncbi:MAG: hypothetical protein OEM59_11440 [Rhodospirillales bacterium]|nr:hypothetical protein [Rhodospirillales bacterium]